MTQTINYPLSTTFAGVNTLQADGIVDSGNNLPNGIAGFLDIVNSSMRSNITQNDPPTATGIRSEITMPASAVTGECWYDWEFMLPSGFAPTTDPIVLMQMHNPDLDTVAAIPFTLAYQPIGYLSASVPAQVLPAAGTSTTIIGSSNIIYDHWYKACLHINWQPNNTGFREFYLDNVALFKQWNVPTTYNDQGHGGNYFKVGCYDGTHNARFGAATMYVRNVSGWTGNDGYEAVIGGIPTPRIPILL